MKQILLLTFVITIITSGCVQYKKVDNPELLKYQKVQEIEELSKDDIYHKTLEWMAKTFKSSKAVIEHKDKETGTIIGNSRVTLQQFPVTTITYTITINCKDNKYRMTFENFYYYLDNFNDRGILESEKNWEKLKPVLDEVNYDLLSLLLESTYEKEW